MENWYDNKDLKKAYDEAFDKGYETDSFRGFLETVEESMREIIDDEDLLEEIMVDAEENYGELSAKYAGMQ
jgi:hypothetical protein